MKWEPRDEEIYAKTIIAVKQHNSMKLQKELQSLQHCWMLHVTSVCTPCCVLLPVVESGCAKFETSQTFKLPTLLAHQF